MTTPTFTPPPTAPNRGMADSVFVAAMNAFLAWVATWAGEVSTAVTWMAAQVAAVLGYSTTASADAAAAAASAVAAGGATSLVGLATNSLTPSVAAKALTGLARIGGGACTFANGDRVVVVSRSDESVWFRGPVSSAVMGSGTMTVTPASSADIGVASAKSDWLVRLEAFDFLPSASAAQLLAAASDRIVATPKIIADAAAFLSLTDASTVAWDTNSGRNAILTLTAAGHTIGAPTNLKDGADYLLLVNPATYGAPSWNAVWEWGVAGAPTLTASAWNIVAGVYNAANGKIHANVRR